MTNITMTLAQYNALMALALTMDFTAARTIRDAVEKANDIKRYELYVRWQDVGGQPPPRIELGKGWPLDQTALITLDRPISKEDVEEYLELNTNNPVTVMVTPDRNGEIGWSSINDYNF